jgi:uncharacterized protein (TIGR04141 family)
VPELEFADDIQPISDLETRAILDLELGELLGRSEPGEEIALVIPDSCMDQYPDAARFEYRFGLGRSGVADTLALEDILARVVGLCAGQRVKALRRGRIVMFGDEAGEEILGDESAAKWLEVCVRYDGKQYFYLDDRWYEFGDRYVAAVHREVAELLARGSTVTLPPWYRGPAPWDEQAYCEKAGFDCLDRRLVKTRVHHRKGIEMCDLFPDTSELVHIKHAWKSAPLSHLFKQAVVAAVALDSESVAVAGFAEAVRERGAGRTLPADFRPRKVVFGILLKDGVPLSADTLFTFSQIALLDAVDVLNDRGISVDVISIEVTRVPIGSDYTEAA